MQHNMYITVALFVSFPTHATFVRLNLPKPEVLQQNASEIKTITWQL